MSREAWSDPMRRPLLLAAALLATTLAGCTGGGPSGDGVEDPATAWASPDDPLPVGEDHDHRDAAQHRFARNATLLAHASLEEWGRSNEVPVGAHALAVRGGLLAVAVNGGETGEGQNGFHLFDVSRPGALGHLAFWDAGEPVNGDRTIAFSPDGGTVFLGFEDGGRPGIAAIDVTVPAEPVEAGFWSDASGYGPHTVAAGEIGGVTYVFSLALGVTIIQYDQGAFTVVGKYITNDELTVLDALGMLDPSAQDPTAAGSTYALRSLYGHDMNLYNDPETGKALLLIAYAYDGAKIVDVSIPSAPVLQARWMPPADTSHKHYTHSMTAERMEDGRLVVVVGSETFEEENQAIASPIWILDATDAAAGAPLQSDPVHLGTWRNPGGAPAGHLGLSVHFFRQQDGFLYLSHYHGGVWAFDLRTEAARADVTSFAYILPVPDPAVVPPQDCCIGFDLDGIPMVFDVEVGPGGDVFAADIIQGVTRIGLQHPA